jgi:hypothetical protein
VAETFAEAFSSRRRFRDEGVDGAGWLYGIGKHLLSLGTSGPVRWR